MRTSTLAFGLFAGCALLIAVTLIVVTRDRSRLGLTNGAVPATAMAAELSMGRNSSPDHPLHFDPSQEQGLALPPIIEASSKVSVVESNAEPDDLIDAPDGASFVKHREYKADEPADDLLPPSPVSQALPAAPDHPPSPGPDAQAPSRPTEIEVIHFGVGNLSKPDTVEMEAEPVSLDQDDGQLLPIVVPEAARNTRIRVFCWSSFPDAPDYMIPMLWIDGRRSTAYVLNNAKRFWAGRPIEERTILLFMPGNVQDAAIQGPVNELITGGLKLKAYSAYWEEILQGLAANGLEPGRVVLDFEHGFTIWHLGQGAGGDRAVLRERIAAAWDDPASLAMLPDDLHALNPRQTNWFHDRKPTTAWNHFARKSVADSLRRDIADPLHAVFPDAMITNYNDADYVEVQYDINNWAIPPHRVGRGTSPVLYAPPPTAPGVHRWPCNTA